MEQLGQDGVESRRVVIISQDSFYRELCEDEAKEAKVGSFDFDHPGKTTCTSFWEKNCFCLCVLLLFAYLFPTCMYFSLTSKSSAVFLTY